MTRKVLVEQNSRTTLREYAIEANKSETFPQYLATALATIGAFSAGTCLSWTSPALPLLEDEDATPHLSLEEGSWVASLITLGAFVGAMPAGWLAQLIGRKRTIQILSVPMFISWMLIAFSGSLPGFLIARFLAGIAVGAFSVAIPMYVAELAEPRIRGTLGTFFQLQITAGILFQYLVGIAGDFLLIALIPSGIPVLFLLTFSFMPESPIYLSECGKINEARASLQWFRGPSYDVEDDITKIRDQIRNSENNEAHISDLVTQRSTSRALVIALGLMVFQQLSGINAVIFYTENIFENAGSELPSFVPPIIVGAVMVLATYASTILIDRAGRRILLIISSSVMSVCLAGMATCFYYQEYQDYHLPFWMPLLCLTVYISVFSLGFGPIPWMMLGELFLPQMKGIAGSISAAFNWLLAFTVTKLFQNMLDGLGSTQTFAAFTVICAIATVFVCTMVPETKGKDIDEVQELLGKRKQKKHVFENMEDNLTIEIKK